MFKSFYYLTKPGIVWGNAIAAVAGFFLASGRDFNPVLFIGTIAGLCLVVASSCVLNNFLDRGIDAKMSRTKHRALVTGRIPGPVALAYAVVLGLLGLTTLIAFTNLLTTALALLGMFAYVVVYGYWKRRSWLGTIVGSISGAMPPVIGYTAVTGNLDLAALILFLTLVFWQMPHFYAIAINRKDDYEAAGIPILPLQKGLGSTRAQIMVFTVLFVISSLSLFVFGYTHFIYLIAVGIVGIWWLVLGAKGYQSADTRAWAKRMFGFSLIVLLVWCIAICVDAVVR